MKIECEPHELSAVLAALQPQQPFLPDPPPMPPSDCASFYSIAHCITHCDELRGQKIAMIKLYRSMTGCGLKESKDAIEQHYRDTW